MVTFRLAGRNDYENINSFYNRSYNANRTLEQFLWEFSNCPFGESIYVIAEDNGKIVGTNCVIPINLITSDNQIIRSGKSEDTLVDPEYRGQKIFYKIYEFLFEKCKEANIQVIWGFTSAKKPFRNLGFETPYDHEQCLAVNNVFKSYHFLTSLNPKNKITDRVKILGLCLLSKVRTFGKFKLHKTSYRIEKGEKVISGVDDLILKSQSKSNGSFAIHQPSDFQQWRIYDNPNYYKVHTYSVYDNNDLVALIVFNSHKNKIAYSCQSTFHPDLANKEKVKLLQSITKILFSEGITLVRTWSFNTNEINREETDYFKSAGYTHLNRGIGFVWKKLDDFDLKPEDFYLSRIATQGTI